MDKKGEEHQFFFGMEAVLGILVAGILVTTAANFDSLSNLNKIYAKEDIRLLVETLQSSQGDIEYNYKLKSVYDVQVEKEDITITQSSNILDGYTYYNLTLTKTGDSIEVRKNG